MSVLKKLGQKDSKILETLIRKHFDKMSFGDLEAKEALRLAKKLGFKTLYKEMQDDFKTGY